MGNTCEPDKLTFERITERLDVLTIPKVCDPDHLIVHENLTPGEINKLKKVAYFILPPCLFANGKRKLVNNIDFACYINARFNTNIEIDPNVWQYDVLIINSRCIIIYPKMEIRNPKIKSLV
jgi:hypothetical protein